MNKLIVLSGLLILLVLPMISADMIAPGTKYIKVNSVITNVNDYSDYIFIGVVRLGGALRSLEIINNGNIGERYKFESVSVYMIKKSDFNQSIIDNFSNPLEDKAVSGEEADKIISSLKMQKVIERVITSECTSVFSSIDAKTYYYSVEIGKVKESYDNFASRRNNLIYFYIIIPTIAFFIIIFVIYKRRK